MKKLLFSSALCALLSFQGLAQQIDREELTYYQDRLESGKNTRKIGTSMLVPGAVILATGIVMIASADYDRDAAGMLMINDPNTSLGIGLTLNGLPLSIIGGIMTLAGNSKVKRAQRQLDKISLSYYQNPSYQGLGITLRF